MSRDIKYIGMDVHKEATVIAVLNGSGKLVMESIVETKASSLFRVLIRRITLPVLRQRLRPRVHRVERKSYINHRIRAVTYDLHMFPLKFGWQQGTIATKCMCRDRYGRIPRLRVVPTLTGDCQRLPSWRRVSACDIAHAPEWRRRE